MILYTMKLFLMNNTIRIYIMKLKNKKIALPKNVEKNLTPLIGQLLL